MVENHSSLANVRKRKKSSDKQFVDFAKLDIVALKKYKRTYKLRVRHNCTKAELVTAVTKHFATLPVNEIEIIESFLETLNNQEYSS
jgi:histone deacetylase complex subunit SAP30